MSVLLSFASCKPVANEYISVINDSVCSSFQARADNSVCIAELKNHIASYPERWQTAFQFLSELDMNNLPNGRIDLSEDVYVNISAYQTKEMSQCVAESHKQYIDVQYVAKGREFMALTRDTNLAVVKEYDAQADYMLYDFYPDGLHMANSDVYFIFFPADIHCPCIQVNPSETVTKIVIKIRY